MTLTWRALRPKMQTASWQRDRQRGASRLLSLHRAPPKRAPILYVEAPSNV